MHRTHLRYNKVTVHDKLPRTFLCNIIQVNLTEIK